MTPPPASRHVRRPPRSAQDLPARDSQRLPAAPARLGFPGGMGLHAGVGHETCIHARTGGGICLPAPKDSEDMFDDDSIRRPAASPRAAATVMRRRDPA